MLATLQGIVLPAENPLLGVRDNSGDEHWQRVLVELGQQEQTKDRANSSKLFDDLAHVCMCAKCVEADSDFHAEVAALVSDLSPAETQRAMELVEADRETPDELKDMIEGYRLEARYDYLLAALRAIRPQLVVIQGGKQ